MTRLISLSDLVAVNSVDNAIYCCKDLFEKDDLLIAQGSVEEYWYDISEIKTPPALKTGYTMYILTKHQK